MYDVQKDNFLLSKLVKPACFSQPENCHCLLADLCEKAEQARKEQGKAVLFSESEFVETQVSEDTACAECGEIIPNGSSALWDAGSDSLELQLYHHNCVKK